MNVAEEGTFSISRTKRWRAVQVGSHRQLSTDTQGWPELVDKAGQPGGASHGTIRDSQTQAPPSQPKTKWCERGTASGQSFDRPSRSLAPMFDGEVRRGGRHPWPGTRITQLSRPPFSHDKPAVREASVGHCMQVSQIGCFVPVITAMPMK